MTSDIRGFHHTGILTRDLDGLERTFTSFGFTLSPRSRHLLNERPGQPPVLGCTANRCALFGGAYIELLGIVDESAPDPWNTKAMADQYEGFRILNLDTDDAEATDRRLTAAGLRTSGVLDLEREVDTEDGPRTMRARAAHLDPRSTPEATWASPSTSPASTSTSRATCATPTPRAPWTRCCSWPTTPSSTRSWTGTPAS
ncbi:VOC family protein [Actinomadura yumaensis]|uniref:VOC family protein n=1 Tax=Actinomadura yumaensis TaxID=111807 RepID=UPI00360EEF25